MNRSLIGRSVGEFLVIVVGVLVALAVDDWRQYVEDREIEQELLERLETALQDDARDLAAAEREVRARLWVLDAVLAGLGDDEAAARLRPERLDSLQNPGFSRTWRFEPDTEPLGRTFRLWPEFDLSDDAYQEMLATGSLRIIRDPHVRSTMMRYYRRAEDQGGNERRAGQYQERLESAFASIAVSPGDQTTLPELVSRARLVPAFPVEVRLIQSRMRAQLTYFGNIESARRELDEALGVR